MTCQLPERGQCCCTCRYHLRDYWHCTTAPLLRAEHKGCVCSEPRGWICAPPEGERVFSGWSACGLCEMWARKERICLNKSA